MNQSEENEQRAGFAERTAHFLTTAAQTAPAWYDAEGNWIAASKPPHARERFWLCFALYSNNAAALADAVLLRTKTAQTPQEFSIFDPNIAAALLASHRAAMAPEARHKLENLVEAAFGFYPGNRQPDFQFHGYNDNMPAKATLGLILGGELLNNQQAVEYGLWNLRQLRAMLVRRGINSEFNSPTYSPLTIHALGEIAAHAQNAEARELARGLEERLWLDLAARFHPETGVLAGPYSRAYTTDTIAHLSLMASLLWFHVGERARPSPLELFAPPPDLVLHHMGDVPFNIAQMSWLAAGSYHLPDAARALLEKKSYPFGAVASYELGDGGADSPGRAGHLETWQQADFTLGTASTPYRGGLSYFATYRRRQNVDSFRDVGTVFSKIVLDDEVPGTIKSPAIDGPAQSTLSGANDTPAQTGHPTLSAPYSNSGEEDHLVSHDNTITLQARETALVLTHPHLSLGGPPDGAEAGGVAQYDTARLRPIARLSELVIFPSHFGGADEIIVGEAARHEWNGEVGHGEWIVARRGRLLIGIRPLVYSRTLGAASFALEKINNYEVIRSTFYQGQAREFTRGELRHVFGGFVAEHASVDEYESLEAFAKVLCAAGFTDYFWTTRRTRYRRAQSTLRVALDLEVSWSPGTHAPRYATINGQSIEAPIARINGVASEEMPFLNEEFRPVPGFFPWDELKVVWGDWPSAIGDREE